MSEIFLEGLGRVELDLDCDEVAACSDEAQLAGWFGLIYAKIDEIECFISGYRDAGRGDEDWKRRAGGKLGYLRLAKRWVERRLLELGIPPPYPPTDPRTREIRRMERQIADLKRELADTRAGKMLASAAAEPAQ